MRLVHMMRGGSMPTLMLVGLAGLWFPMVSDMSPARAAESSSASLQEQGDGLMKNVEEMVAHGGMGDAKAIIHHCGEATRIAEKLIKQRSASDLHRADARILLNVGIPPCHRVSDICIPSYPVQLLNPATNPRATAHKTLTVLSSTQMNRDRVPPA